MMIPKKVMIQELGVGAGCPLFFIAGPCVIESRKLCMSVATQLRALAAELEVGVVFKASYDKANRTSLNAFRGPGIDKGLDILQEIKETLDMPVLTDVHSPEEASRAGSVVDVIQIPAFLCRQTDLLVAAGESGAVVNIKKAQFLAPWDMGPVIEKVESTGNQRILLTERGTTFGYNNLVADMRSVPYLSATGYPVIFDATHSVQKPGGGGGYTSGDGALAPVLARAAVAAGCHGVFMETHPNPEEALSDRENCVPLAKLRGLWETLIRIADAAR